MAESKFLLFFVATTRYFCVQLNCFHFFPLCSCPWMFIFVTLFLNLSVKNISDDCSCRPDVCPIMACCRLDRVYKFGNLINIVQYHICWDRYVENTPYVDNFLALWKCSKQWSVTYVDKHPICLQVLSRLEGQNFWHCTSCNETSQPTPVRML